MFVLIGAWVGAIGLIAALSLQLSRLQPACAWFMMQLKKKTVLTVDVNALEWSVEKGCVNKHRHENGIDCGTD